MWRRGGWRPGTPARRSASAAGRHAGGPRAVDDDRQALPPVRPRRAHQSTKLPPVPCGSFTCRTAIRGWPGRQTPTTTVLWSSPATSTGCARMTRRPSAVQRMSVALRATRAGVIDEQAGREFPDKAGLAGHRPGGPPLAAVQRDLPEDTAALGPVLVAEQPYAPTICGCHGIRPHTELGRDRAPMPDPEDVRHPDRVVHRATPLGDDDRILAHRLHPDQPALGRQTGDRPDGPPVHVH